MFQCLAMEADTGTQSAPTGPGAEPGQIVASVNRDDITVADFREEMALRGGDLPGQYQTEVQRRELLDEMIRQRALVEAARARGHDADPAVVAVFERAMVAAMLQNGLDRRLSQIVVTDEEVARHYAEHADSYSRPGRYRAAIVFFEVSANASDERRADLRRLAERAMAETEALGAEITHFGSVARKYSDDRASRYNGGVIGWLLRHPRREYRWAPEVVDAIFALSSPGELGPIVSTESGLFLVRLVAVEAAGLRTLEEVEDGIRHQLLRDKRQELREVFMAGVLADAVISVDDELFNRIEPPPAADKPTEREGPPALPGVQGATYGHR
jgi:parvulin-like peptidyl-prolyl isomerase